MRVEARSHSIWFFWTGQGGFSDLSQTCFEISNTVLPVNPHSRGFRTAAMDWTDMGWKQDQIRIQGKEILLFVRLSNPVHFFWNLELISLRDQNSSMQSSRCSLLFFAAVLLFGLYGYPRVFDSLRLFLFGGDFSRWSELRVCADTPELSALCCAKCCWVCVAPPGEIFGAARVLKGARGVREVWEFQWFLDVSSKFLGWLKRFRVLKKPSWMKHILIWVSERKHPGTSWTIFFFDLFALGSWFDTITLTSFGQDEMFHFQLKRNETVRQPWTPAAKDVASGERLLSLGSQGYTSQSVWPRIRLDDPESVSLCFSLFVVIWLTAYCILSYILSTSNTFSPTRTRENERWSVCVQEVREELLERLTTTEGTISCGFQLGQDRSNVHITSGCISSAKTSMYVNLIQKWFWLHHWHHWHHSARILLRFLEMIQWSFSCPSKPVGTVSPCSVEVGSNVWCLA